MTCRVGKSLPVKLRLLSNDSPFEMVFGGYLVFNEPAHIDSSPSIRRAGKNENRRDSMGPAVCVPSPSQQQRRNEKTGRRSVGSVALRAQGRHFYLVSQGTLKKQFTFDIYINIYIYFHVALAQQNCSAIWKKRSQILFVLNKHTHITFISF